MACIIEQIIIALLAFLASIAGAVKEREMPEPTTVVETTQTPHTPSVGIVETAPQATVQTTESVLNDYSRGFKHYRVNGVLPPYEWQWYLYGQLADRGISWFYPHAICQIYQESNWNRWADNGRGDLGLTQQKAVYWADRAAQAGIPGADIWEPYAQLFVYAWQMAQYLAAANYNVEEALSIYFLGYAGYAGEYVGGVLKWMDYLEVIP